MAAAVLAAFSAVASAADHFYTTSLQERDAAITSSGYRGEGITGYLYTQRVGGTVQLLRLFNPTTGDHFYTTNAQEAQTAQSTGGYRPEGVAGFCFNNNRAGSVPLFRLFNGQDHFYTISAAERDAAIATAGYRSEGVTCNVVPDAATTPTPFYRLINRQSGFHFLTASLQERDGLVLGPNPQWTSEGIAGYVFTGQVARTVPLYRILLTNGQHVFTILAAERDALIAQGGRDEGVAGFVYGACGGARGQVTVYRVQNRSSGERFITTNFEEYQGLVRSGGWENENVACWFPNSGGLSPFYRLFHP